MLRLSFNYVVLENFKAFSGKHKFKLAPSAGLYFVQGRNLAEPDISPNGVAKTTLFDAIFWCLTGRTSAGLIGPDVRPWNKTAKQHTSVRLWLTTNGTVRLIERCAGPNDLLLDGEACGQEQIDQAIGMTAATLAHTILIGQGRPLFFDLQPREKMALLSNVLNLNRWAVYSDAADKKAKSLARESAEAGNALSVALALQRETAEALKRAKERMQSWKDSNRKEIAILERGAAQAKIVLSTIDKRLAEQDLRADSAETELRALKRRQTELQSAHHKAAVRAEMVAAQREALLKELKEKRRTIESAENKRCPTCGGVWSTADKHVATLKRSVEDITNKLRVIDVDKLRGTARELSAELDKVEAHIKSFRVKADEARDNHDAILAERKSAEASVIAHKRLCEQAQKDVNPHRKEVAELGKRSDELDGKIAAAQKRVDALAHEYDLTHSWVNGFRAVRLQLIKEFLDDLSLVTNSLLPEFGLRKWRIAYEIERETQAGTIKSGLEVLATSPSSGKQRVKWNAWSGGEAQRLRLCGTLALSEVLLAHAGVTCDLNVLDEPTRGLSASGADDLCEMLSDYAERLQRRVYYIDHRVIESSRFAGTVTVCKDEDGAYID